VRILLILLMLFSTTAVADDHYVYLLAKVKLKGTTYTQIAFFHDEEVKDLASCEKERNFGRRGNWRRYTHYVVKNTGLSLHANYFCVQTQEPLSGWQEHAEYEHVYLVDVNDGDIKLIELNTYMECLNKMRETQEDETHTFFCAKSNQTY